MSSIQLICESISFAYSKSAPVFTNYSHTFSQGITVLKGYSGCGKTTLLKILAGYLSIQSGKIITPNRINPRRNKYLRKEVSYMFQGINLLPLATVERNLRLCAEMATIPGRQWKPRMFTLLDQLGISDLRKTRAGNLSGGQAQRAALARTLIRNTPIVLLDEPTSGLDDTNTQIIKDIIIQESQNKICLVSSHDSRLFDIAHEIIDFNKFISN